jgi:DNA-binding HxlR family transcriptional regulator
MDTKEVEHALSFNLAFCPIEETLRIIDGKWTLLLLRDLLQGSRRFGELRRSLVGISPKTLEEQGIVRRAIYPEIPPRVEYCLTEYGETLRPILEAMAIWGFAHAARNASLQ